jgi:16S rRNA (guanine(966)-N(2))-methyltransferase RsmD
VVLDICAGSGALGLEALSRGASRLVAIDRASPAQKTIRSNAADLGLGGRVRVLGGDARQVLPRLDRRGERFDLVFFDPPYDAGLESDVLALLAAGDLLSVDARVVVEGAKRHPLPPVPGLAVDDERVYGDTVLSFLTRTDVVTSSAEP